MAIRILLTLSLLITTAFCIYPKPSFENLDYQNTLHISPKICDFGLKLDSQINNSQFNHYLYLNKFLTTFKLTKKVCQTKNYLKYHILQQGIDLINLSYDTEMTKQAYKLIIQQDKISIKTGSYSGYVYALETLSQIISQELTLPTGIIEDEPLVEYRGIMIDSARHFLEVSTIKKLIQTMPIVKLNILHWHLSDDQAFALQSGSHPEISKYGSLGAKKVYTTEDVQMLLRVAKENAVEIIPEITTPVGVRSWALAPQWKDKNLTLKCGTGKNYEEQLDISKKDTLSLAQSIIREVDYLFSESPYFHVGGSSINEKCWNTSAINTFKTIHNLKTFPDLVNYWRFEVKQALDKTRKVIHWQDQHLPLETSENDVVQYNGLQQYASQTLSKSSAKVILSPVNILNLGTGFGGIFGDPHDDQQHQYNLWKTNIYNQFQLFPEGIDRNRILGAEVVVEGHRTNNDELENNIWMRAAAFAGRVWTEQKLDSEQLLEELIVIKDKLIWKGAEASPLTVQVCEKHPKGCINQWRSQKAKAQQQSKSKLHEIESIAKDYEEIEVLNE